MDIERTTPLIVTPSDEDRVFVFHKNNRPAHVIEIPGCRFGGLPVCLATPNAEELARLKYNVMRFRQFWEDLADRGIPIVGK